MIDTATWFGPVGGELFGWFCTPDSGMADYAVLLCPPVGEEEHNAHETFRRLAWALADIGIASLRFDYQGTGDSTGGWDDPGRVPAWLASVCVAYDALRATGAPMVGTVGLRLGATLLAAAAPSLDVDLAVLWDPCSGKSMLREGYARRADQTESTDGSVDTPGYRYSAGTVQEMRDLDPASFGPFARNTLILVRPDRPPTRGLRHAFTAGPETEWDTCVGLAEMLDVPMDHNAPAVAAVDQVVQWIARHAQRGETCAIAVATRDLQLDGSNGHLCESVVRLGSPGLVAVLTEPERRTRAGFVVFVNVANDRHVGPGRTWVETARQLASKGFRCIRVNQSATGDSCTPQGRPFGLLYCREWLEDLPAALVDPIFTRERLALVSLCSGAYSSLEAATRVPVAVVYPINVILTVTDTGRGQRLYDARRRVARPINRAFVPWLATHPRATRAAWRAYRQISVWNAPMAAVRQLVRRGTAVVLVMGPDDGRHFNETIFWNMAFAPRWQRQRLFDLVVRRSIDHPLMTHEGQRAALDAVVADLERRFAANFV